jgi:Polyketide cyclase / dehydrase and lipid transport
MKKGTSGKVATNIDVSPEVLYDLVSDVRRMGEWSPECRRCEWIDGATGPAVGARFKGSNAHGLARWSTTTKVVAAESGREFAFVTGHLGRDMTKWSYRFEPASNGTVVTESFEMLRDVPWYFRLGDRYLMGVKDRRADLEKNMAETLQRLKVASENRDSST